MRVKIVTTKLTACVGCASHDSDGVTCRCDKTEKVIRNCRKGFPKWCPLPDAPEAKKGEK